MQDVSTQTGDVVTFVALVADNYGRKASSVLSRYKILEGKELEYLAYDMLDLTGQTYGTEVWLWGDRIFEKCGIGRDEGGDGGKTLEIRGKRRLSARDGGANYQQS